MSGASAQRRRAAITGILTLGVAAMTIAGIAVYVADATQQHAIALPRQAAIESFAIDPAESLIGRPLAVAACCFLPNPPSRFRRNDPTTDRQGGGMLLDSSSGANEMAFGPDEKLPADADAQGTVSVRNSAALEPAGPNSGTWLITVACVIAIVVSALAVIITIRAIPRGVDGHANSGRQLWKSCS